MVSELVVETDVVYVCVFDTRATQVPVLKGENNFDMRILVDRSIIEAFMMGGRSETSFICTAIYSYK